MSYWQIVLLLAVGAGLGFAVSAKLSSRYYIGVGLGIVLHAYMKAAEDLEMMDQLSILADGANNELRTEEGFDEIFAAAKKTVKGAMFE